MKEMDWHDQPRECAKQEKQINLKERQTEIVIHKIMEKERSPL